MVTIRAAASANLPLELPYNMTFLPALSDSLFERDGLQFFARLRAAYTVGAEQGTAS
jgi:hypothetical protein